MHQDQHEAEVESKVEGARSSLGCVQLFDDTTQCKKNQRKPLCSTQLLLENNLFEKKKKKDYIKESSQ